MDELKTFRFSKGAHKTREQGMCVMEAVAYLAGEPHSDTPQCADPVITYLAQMVNDLSSDDERQELLLDLPWRIVGTKSTKEIEDQRALMSIDWAIHVLAPWALRQHGLDELPKQLESYPAIDSRDAALGASVGLSHLVSEISPPHSIAKSHSPELFWPVEVLESIVFAASNHANPKRDIVSVAAYIVRGIKYAALLRRKTNASNRDLLKACVDLIDRLIRLTEPQEVTVAQRIPSNA